MQPNFKVLDYETHGPDLFEDMLKAVESQVLDKNPLANEKIASKPRIDDQDNIKFDSIDDKEGELYIPVYSQPPETIVSNNENGKADKVDRKRTLTGKSLMEINLSFSEYLRSFFSKSKEIKEKMNILNEGIKRIDERLDIFNLFKKLREFDKLKLLLLENEQFVLFDSLPRPELVFSDQDKLQNSKLLSKTKIKDAQFIQDKIKLDLILLSYKNLKSKSEPTILDKRLFEIYDDILL